VIRSHLGSTQVARVVYGAIIGLALIVALQKHPPAPGTMIASLMGTAVAVGLAELYAEIVGIETRERHRVRRDQLGELRDDSFAVGFGVAFPAVFFLLSALGLIEVGTAFTIAKWTGLGLIGFYGFWAARLAGSPTNQALVKATLVALIGAGLILLKSLVH
jgi:multidrug transporter EmrE-like cation transporter